MFQASEERRLRIEREKQYRTSRQRYLRECAWDGMKQETEVSRKGS